MGNVLSSAQPAKPPAMKPVWIPTRTRRTAGGCGDASTGTHVCSDGQTCVNGQSTTSCQNGQTACSGSCVDTSSDPTNCGGCGDANTGAHICGNGQTCSDGQCGGSSSECTDNSQCSNGTICCDGACLDTESDPANCSGCGHACPEGWGCCKGFCTPPNSVDLATLFYFCDGQCGYDFDANCGACGAACVRPGRIVWVRVGAVTMRKTTAASPVVWANCREWAFGS